MLNHAELSGLTYEEWLEDLRGLVFNSRQEVGLNWEDLAREANLLPSTVARFADGTTKRPHGRTIFELTKLFESRRKPNRFPTGATANESVPHRGSARIKVRVDQPVRLRRLMRRFGSR